MGETAKSPVLDRKRAILDGAAEILAANGFHGARMAQIAGASGITGPALYRHFAGKDALHAAVIERGTDILEEVMSRTVSAGPPALVLRETLAALARVGIDHTPLWLILLRDARYLPDDERVRHSRRVAALMDDLTVRIRAVRIELDDRDAELVARAVLVATASPSGSRLRGLSDARRRRLLEGVLTRVTEVRLPAEGDGSAAPPQDDASGDPAPPVERVARREAIVDAAHYLFRRYGFHAVSMEDVAVAAGVTGPTVYSYFESKSELLVVAQQRGAAWLALCLNRALRTEPTATLRFTAAVTSYVDFALDYRDTMAVLVQEACNLPEEVLATVVREHHDYTSEVAGLLRSIRPDLEEPVARSMVCGSLDLVSTLSTSRRHAVWLRPRLLALVGAVSSVPVV